MHSKLVMDLVKIIADGSKLAVPFWHDIGNGVDHSLNKDGHDETSKALTKADVTVEQFIMTAMAEKFPSVVVIAEETKDSHVYIDRFVVGDFPDEWMTLDPIDGTWLFRNHRPEFGTQATYGRKNEVLATFIAFPLLDEMIVAAEGVISTFRMSDAPTRLATHFSKAAEREIPGKGFVWIDRKNPSHEKRWAEFSAHALPERVWANAYAVREIVAGRANFVYFDKGTSNQIWDSLPLVHALRVMGGRESFADGAPLTHRDLRPPFREAFCVGVSHGHALKVLQFASRLPENSQHSQQKPAPNL